MELIIGTMGVLLCFLFGLSRLKSSGKRKLNRSKQKPQKTQLVQRALNELITHNEPVISANDPNDGIVDLESKPVPEELEKFKLLMPAELSGDTTKKVIAMTKEINRPKSTFNRLASGVSDTEELVEIVKSDLELTAKVLRVVNSSAFALSQPITSISHAIIFLGVALIKDIATQFLLKDVIIANSPEQQDACSKLWIASNVAGSVGLLLAQMLKHDQAAEISTQAMLSYIGDLALVSGDAEIAKNYLTENSLFCRVSHCQDEIGVNAALVGNILASEWELPDQVVSGLKNSLLPMVLSPDDYPWQEDGMKQTLLCYIAGRIGDLVAFEGLKDIAEVNFSQRKESEFFYLSGHIHKAGLSNVFSVFKEPSFQKKINLLISQLNP